MLTVYLTNFTYGFIILGKPIIVFIKSIINFLTKYKKEKYLKYLLINFMKLNNLDFVNLRILYEKQSEFNVFFYI